MVVLQWLSAPSRHSPRHQESSTRRFPAPSAGLQSLVVVRLFSSLSPFARVHKKRRHSFQTGALASNPRTKVCADPVSFPETRLWISRKRATPLATASLECDPSD